jgi:hypothetical protein
MPRALKRVLLAHLGIFNCGAILLMSALSSLSVFTVQFLIGSSAALLARQSLRSTWGWWVPGALVAV